MITKKIGKIQITIINDHVKLTDGIYSNCGMLCKVKNKLELLNFDWNFGLTKNVTKFLNNYSN